MSSLLQFHGEIGRQGVLLEFERYIQDIDKPISECYLDPRVPCTICGKDHPQVGVAWRKPCGMLGCWVQFRYLGAIHAPDLSVPICVPEWPKGTRILTPEENSELWHRE